MCLEAASIRQGRGVAHAAARQSIQDWKVRKENLLPGAHRNTEKAGSGKHMGRHCHTERACRHKHALHDTRESQECNAVQHAHKRPLRTHSPCALPTKRPALSSAPATTKRGVNSWKSGSWPEVLKASECDHQQCLIVRHTGTKDDIPPAWQQAIAEAEAKGRIDEDAENRAAQLSHMMDRLGRKACARVSHEKYIQAFEKELIEKAANKGVERLAKMSRTRRSRLHQATMGIGELRNGCTVMHNRVASVENERVRRSVYCRQGYSQDTESRQAHNTENGETQVDVGTAVRVPFAELEPGFFSKSNNCQM